MTNQQFGASDTAAVYDCNRGSSAAANMNREEEEKKDSCKNNGNNGHLSNGSYLPVGNGNGHSMSMTTTTGSYHLQDNPEKPPYGTTTEDIECQGPGDDNRPLTWLQKLHMVLVVISSATINGVVFGVVNNFGVFYVYLIELFKSDTSLLSLTGSDDQSMMMPTPADSVQAENQTASSGGVDSALLQPLIAGVGSLNIGLIFFCSIFASVLSDRYGIRQVCFVGGILATIGMYASSVSVHIVYMYITYGLVLGIGASLVYAPSLAILGHYFTAKIGLVNSLVTAGSSVFSIVMPIVLRRLINAHGVQNTFKYLTGLMGVLILCSLTFKEKLPRPTGSSVARRKSAEAAGQQQHQHPHHGSRSSLASIFQFEALWKNKLYLCWLISIPTGLFGYFVPFCHLVKHAQDINSQYPGEVLVMFISIFSLIGRLCSGPLADFGKINRIALQQLSFVSIGVLTMSLTVITDFSLLLVCCGLGFFDGCFISLLGPIAFDLVGQEYGNQAIGLLLCFCSLPLTTGPPIAAYAYGLYGNYTLAFFLAGIPPIVAAVLMFNIIRLQRSSAAASAASSSHRGAFMPADNLSNGLSNGFGCGERGEKLHLLPNGNGVSTASAATTATTVSSAGDSSSPVKLRSLLSTENSSSITDETSSENASLLKASSNGNHASILPANGNSHAKQGPALVAYT